LTGGFGGQKYRREKEKRGKIRLKNTAKVKKKSPRDIRIEVKEREKYEEAKDILGRSERKGRKKEKQGGERKWDED